MACCLHAYQVFRAAEEVDDEEQPFTEAFDAMRFPGPTPLHAERRFRARRMFQQKTLLPQGLYAPGRNDTVFRFCDIDDAPFLDGADASRLSLYIA